MSVFIKQSSILLLVVVALLGCKDEFELNSPYARKPVVYSLLDRSLDSQIVMINRTFLGSGSATAYAELADSSNYINVDAKISWNDGASSVQLEQMVITDKYTDGIFFAPNQIVYGAPTEAFDFDENLDDLYTLSVKADGDTIYAQTTQVEFASTAIKRPLANPKLALVKPNSSTPEPVYKNDVEVWYESVPNAIKHSVSCRLNYTNNYYDGTKEDVTVQFLLGNSDAQDISGGEDIKFDFSGQFFYETINNRIEIDENVNFRSLDTIRPIQFVYSVFADDLSTYLSIASPTSGVGQEGIEFSNINDGEGLGVFSSRSNKVRTIVNGLDARSFDELKYGQFTAHLNFCDLQAGNVIEFACP